MKRFLKYFLGIIVLLALWAVIGFYGTKNGWFHKSITNSKFSDAFINASKKEIEKAFVGNFAMATFKNGIVESETFHSAGKKVDRNTIFQVASLSKWISAIGIMKLVEDGKLDLDTPVSIYLTRWKLPKSTFDNSKVTVRRLLSHTAGLTDGLGYSGFKNGEKTQAIEASLTKAIDADEGISGEVKVGIEPGTAFKYSGGGYTLLQLLVEEITGQTFSFYMKQEVLDPIGMTESSYVWDESRNTDLVEFYNADGSKAPHYKYTSLAATSLYTSLADLEIFFNSFLNNKSVLKSETLKLMRKPLASSFGMDIWGLGNILYAPIDNGDFIFGHDGKSTPPINTAIRLNPQTGNGIIVLETGYSILATKLAAEWVFWKTGKVDLTLFTMLKDNMVSMIGIGWIVILISSVFIGVWRRVRKKRSSK